MRSSTASSPKHQTCSEPGGVAGSRGQATVEFALVLPLILVVALALLDIAWLAIDQCRLSDAARVAARAAIVDDAEPARTADSRSRDILGPRVRISVDQHDGLLTVRVARRHEFLTPFMSWLVRDVTLVGTSTMLQEPRVTTIGD